MPKDNKSFFERLTGSIASNEEEELEDIINGDDERDDSANDKDEKEVEQEQVEEAEEEAREGHLTIDMLHTPTEVIIKSVVAGVKPENLDISISKDMITIKGSRQKTKEITEENYYYQELYWGGFTRSVLLPHEVDTENAEAKIKNGLLVIKLPIVNKKETKKLKIKAE